MDKLKVEEIEVKIHQKLVEKFKGKSNEFCREEFRPKHSRFFKGLFRNCAGFKIVYLS
jgi:hypothetical protein